MINTKFFLSFLNHASKICLMILRLKALTNKQNFDHKYKNIFSVPFSCDFSHSHMFNFNEHNQCKSPKHKLNNWSNLHITDWMHAGTVTRTHSLSKGMFLSHQAPSSPKFLKSILSLKTEFLPHEIHALFP